VETQRPYCFVLMPFDVKPDPAGGGDIDFDRIYSEAIQPAVDEAGLQPIRADEERTGGIIHKAMFERLLLCDFAVADLTTANPNVCYELGVRHTARPRTTVSIFAKRQRIPFDVNYLRGIPYEFGERNEFGPDRAQALRRAVGDRLRELRALAAESAPIDSPLFQLLGEWKPDLARLKTDLFVEHMEAGEGLKRALSDIRARARAGATEEAQAALDELVGALPAYDAVETGCLVDVLLTFRALSDWDGMIRFAEGLPHPLVGQVLVREQLAFAYNRRAEARKDESDRTRALELLDLVESAQGPSSETAGLRGRVHKGAWLQRRDTDAFAAAGHLDEAIDAYRRGFTADPRDAYPGVNLVTLLHVRGDAGSLRERDYLLPVVRFAVERRLAGNDPDYWDHATRLELAAIESRQSEAEASARRALACADETWKPKTTLANLRLIDQAHTERDRALPWLTPIVAAFARAAGDRL
jgi:tetratricopeptide (TPR) repeat protein